MIRSEISEKCQIEDMPQLIIDYFNKQSIIPDTSFIVVIRSRTIKGVRKSSLLSYKVTHVRAILYAMWVTIAFILVYSGLGVPAWK